ncbi:MAG: nitroreductase family protein [Bacteroidales bacterium]
MNPCIQTLLAHKSIRKYKEIPIDPKLLTAILTAASRASTTGNMQLYSIMVTQDAQRKQDLAKFHFNQPMITQAPVVLTFMADVNRFHHWCKINEAEKSYDNFLWFINGVIDALLAAQNACIAAESEGLGICYLGTTTYNAKGIAQFFKVPKGVVPITTMTMGIPDEKLPLTDRIPLEGVVHYETYHPYTDQDIQTIFSEKENLEETQALLAQNKLPNLAQIFTKNRYTKADAVHFSTQFLQFLKEAEFMNDRP